MTAAPLHPGISPATVSQLDFGRILARLAELTRTDVGAAAAQVPRLPSDPAEVAILLAETREARALTDLGETIPLVGITNVGSRIDHAARQATLDAPDLLAIARTLRGFWMLRSFFTPRREESPRLAALALGLPALDELRETLFDAIDDKGELKDDASAELLELRTRKRQLHERIRARIQSMLRDVDVLDHLQDTWFTIREDRYVLPVRSGERSDVDGIIHGSSQTGRTLFIEPAELVPINNELKLCEQAVKVEEQRILAWLSEGVGEHAIAIAGGLEHVALLDGANARARLGGEMDATLVTIAETDRVRLLAARNPILALRGIPVVQNDIILDGEARFLVITGPNAGGKTVTLSTLGLFGLMLRAGLALPVGDGSVLPVFGEIAAILGDAQDLGADLSTFSGHLTRLVAAHEQVARAKVSGQPCLLLLDELAAGTEPEQGSALGMALLETFADAGAVGAVTTHFDRLKTLSLGDPRFVNAAVGFDAASKRPTYRLSFGTPGSSSAFDIARRIGLDAATLDRASALLGDESRSLDAILKRLEAERDALSAERELVRAERKRVAHDRDLLARKIERLELEGQTAILDQKRKALADVAEARELIASIVRELQRDRDPRTVERRRVKIAETERKLREGMPATEAPRRVMRRLPVTHGEAAPGLPVFVPHLDREGVIETVRGSNVGVVLGDLRLTVKLDDLLHGKPKLLEQEKPSPNTPKPLVKAERPEPARPAPPPAPTGPPPRSPDITCDVRGMRGDEALTQIDRFLDGMTLAGRNAAFVLHGHGTGRLKAQVREAFRTSRYVESWEPASEEQGGDAVTLVWLA
ncbi:MAG: Smr/MutS family protein [Myxococcales bacterium]|nr:Smr/MutS family protein [Myxococcales bacterium]